MVDSSRLEPSEPWENFLDFNIIVAEIRGIIGLLVPNANTHKAILMGDMGLSAGKKQQWFCEIEKVQFQR